MPIKDVMKIHLNEFIGYFSLIIFNKIPDSNELIFTIRSIIIFFDQISIKISAAENRFFYFFVLYFFLFLFVRLFSHKNTRWAFKESAITCVQIFQKW